MSKIKRKFLDFDIYTQNEVDTISGSLSAEINLDISTHSSSADHDGRYYTETEINTWRSSTTQTEMGYIHGVTDDVQTQIDTKASVASQTTLSGNLQTNIDGKSDTGHAHTESDISDLDKYTQTEVDTISGSLTETTADAVTNEHVQNTDTHLGTVDQDISLNTYKLTNLSVPDNTGQSVRTTTKITESNLENAIDLRHSDATDHAQNTDTDLDPTFEATFVKKTDTVNVLSDITSASADIEDAVTKRHTQNTDTDLDSTFEATFVKKVDNVNVLADITSTGANIEDAVTKRHTQNTDIGRITFNCPAITLANTEEIQLHRFTTGASKSIKVWATGVSTISGTTNANLKTEIYNHTDTTSVYSNTSSFLTGEPVGTYALSSKDISIRITNNTGAVTDCNGFITITQE